MVVSDEPIVDADVIPDEPAGAEPDRSSTALAVSASVDANAGAIIRAEQPEEIIAKATTLANALKGLIDGQGMAVNVGGRRKHVEVGAWQACGTMLGALGGQPLHAETVWTRPVMDGEQPKRTVYTAEVKHFKKVDGQRQHVSTTTYDVDGLDWEACVEVKTAGGVTVGRAEAMVSRAEETWSRRDDFALRSMAETRSESRAWRRAIGWIVHLAGYSPTPAEEMGHTPGADTTPALAPLPDQERAAVLNALGYTLSPLADRVADEKDTTEVAAAITAIFDGALPQKVGQAITAIAGRRQRLTKEELADVA